MTLNIWNYQGDWPRRREIIARLIDLRRPEVVALQETRHDPRYERGRGQGEQLAEMLGYHLTAEVAHVYLLLPRVDEGLSILTTEQPSRVMRLRLSRAPLLKRARVPEYRGDGNRRLCLGVEIEFAGRAVTVYNTHFSLSARARLDNAIETAEFIRTESRDAPAILMGDLNADPDDAPLRYLRGESKLDGAEGDFTDCWTSLHPTEAGYTDESWDPRRRLDYVLARNIPDYPVRAELVGTEPVGGVYASDHLGLLVEFRF